jgi:uncharacterized protein (DUF1015 family)
VPSSPAPPEPPVPNGLEVRPFRALTYRQRDPEQLARVSSPAYDLITPADRECLANADPHNIVRLILPRVDPGIPAPGDRVPGGSAEEAARTLREWRAAGVLERDDAPALWLYELRPPNGTPATLGWLAAVALPAPGSRAVLPHEDTFPPAVEGRRALLAATRTDLEPIVLAHDPEPVVAELAARVHADAPTLRLRDSDGVEHTLWRVADPALLDDLVAALRQTTAVIADGHHRFAAALAHRREVTRPGSGACSAVNAGADAILALLTPMGAGGLRLEAIHRVVPGLAFDEALRTAADGFEIRELPVPAGGLPGLVRAADRWLHDPAEGGFLVSDGTRLVQLRHPSAEIREAVPAAAPAAVRGLDVVLAHAGLVQHLWRRDDGPRSILVAHTVEEALRSAAESDGVALLLRAPSPADVADVARAGARMPRKSTLFVPKPRTGLVLRPHED